MPADIFHDAADGNKVTRPADGEYYPARNIERPASLKRTNLAKIRTWIERGGNVNGEPDPALREETEYKSLLIDVVYPGNRLLSVAAECGRVDVMRLLLANGADVNYVNNVNFGRTPVVPISIREGVGVLNALALALYHNREVAVRLLIEHGADVTFAHNGTFSMLGTVTTYPRVLKMLLAAGADPSWQDSEGLSVEDKAYEEYVETSDEVTAISARQATQPWPHLAEAVRQRDGLQETYEILRGARLAGSYKKYVIQMTYPPAKDLLVLRALVCGSRRTAAGRAVAGSETPKAVARLFESSPDGVFWLVIKYWKLGDWYYPLVQEPRRKQPIPSSSSTSSTSAPSYSSFDFDDDDDDDDDDDEGRRLRLNQFVDRLKESMRRQESRLLARP